MSGSIRSKSPIGSTRGSSLEATYSSAFVEKVKDNLKIEKFNGDRTKLRYFLT
jgi:hypothetical protein